MGSSAIIRAAFPRYRDVECDRPTDAQRHRRSGRASAHAQESVSTEDGQACVRLRDAHHFDGRCHAVSRDAERLANWMPVPCFLVAHPKGTLMWDVGVIPDATVEKQAASGGARYDVNATAAALVKRTLKGQPREIGYSPFGHHLCIDVTRSQRSHRQPESVRVVDMAGEAS